MRDFVKIFLLFIFGAAFGRYFDERSFELSKVISSLKSENTTIISNSEFKNGTTISEADNTLSEQKKDDRITVFGMDDVFSKLKNANNETLVILNCENILFTYLDAAFSKENKSIWTDFYEKRSNLDRKMNEKIDRALFFAPKRIIDMKYKRDLGNLRDRGVNIVFVYQIDENKMKFLDEEMIKSVVSSMLSDIGLNPNENSSVKLLITDSKKISSGMAELIEGWAKSNIDSSPSLKTNRKSNSISKIILVHEGNLKLDNKQINLPIEEILINFESPKEDITKDQMKKQIEILGKIGEWIHDVRIREITNCANDEELVYKLCKQSIMDVCSCAEIVEEEIYEKIASIVEDKNVLKSVKEIIDDFQEIHNTLPDIFHYAFRKYLWEVCLTLRIEKGKAVEMLKKMRHFHLNEYEVQDHTYKVVRKLGSGIHWRDMAKYRFVKEFLTTGERTIKSDASLRYKIYMKVMNIVFDRVSAGMRHMMEEQKSEFIRILHENKVEDSKIIKAFNISEEKFKNIINTKRFKNEKDDKKIIKKIEKSQKNT